MLMPENPLYLQNYPQNLARLKRLIEISQETLSTPNLKEDNPSFFFQVREQLNSFLKILKNVEGDKLCQ